MDPLISNIQITNICTTTQFDNPFHIEDLEIFDDELLQIILCNCGFGLTIEKLARSLDGTNERLIKRIEHILPISQRAVFMSELNKSFPEALVQSERRAILDDLFWELTYWKTPELYEELIQGEQLHPGIFSQLKPDLHDKIVLDAGAGSGRATIECAHYGAREVYAVEPSPGLLRILKQKVASLPEYQCIVPFQGRFDQLPLADDSVDTAISCSAFTSDPAQGGEAGIAEFRRVIKSGGKLIIIWPRIQDHDWLLEHSFHYVALPVHGEMKIRFRSIRSAMQCVQRFYAHNSNVVQYLKRERKPEIPFSMLGLNPPRDYCWLQIQKC